MAAGGNEAHQAALRADALSEADVEHLADGARASGWTPGTFGAGLTVARDWGAAARALTARAVLDRVAALPPAPADLPMPTASALRCAWLAHDDAGFARTAERVGPGPEWETARTVLAAARPKPAKAASPGRK